MSLVRHIGKIQRISSIYKSPVSWTRLSSSSTPSPIKPEESQSKSSSPDNPLDLLGYVKPTYLQKKRLVWSGKYKSIDEIPELVSSAAINRAINKTRIKLNLIFMVLTAIASGIGIYTGRRLHQRGDTLTERNLQWHKEYNEKHKTE